jgi:hypothetical protein
LLEQKLSPAVLFNAQKTETSRRKGKAGFVLIPTANNILLYSVNMDLCILVSLIFGAILLRDSWDRCYDYFRNKNPAKNLGFDSKHC